ncbi:hypothetical protein ACI79C_23325 [Geodermatophilus sp. SYSU D00697]
MADVGGDVHRRLHAADGGAHGFLDAGEQDPCLVDRVLTGRDDGEGAVGLGHTQQVRSGLGELAGLDRHRLGRRIADLQAGGLEEEGGRGLASGHLLGADQQIHGLLLAALKQGGGAVPSEDDVLLAGVRREVQPPIGQLSVRAVVDTGPDQRPGPRHDRRPAQRS